MENTNQTQPITVADLVTLRAIVDLAASRGAFRGAELSQVGATFDKLNAFLTDIEEQAKAAQEAEGSTEEANEADSETTQGE